MNTIIVTLKKNVKNPVIVLNKRGWLAISGADRVQYKLTEYIVSKCNKNNSFVLESDIKQVDNIVFVKGDNKNVINNKFNHLPCYDESIIEEMAKRGGL
jgi:hypothetical protein